MTQIDSKRVDILIQELNHSNASNIAVTVANAMAANNIPTRMIIIGERSRIPFHINDKIELKFLSIIKGKNFIEKILYLIRAYFILSVYLARIQCQNLLTLGKESTALAVFMRITLPLPYKIIGTVTSNIYKNLQNDKTTPIQKILNWIYKKLLNNPEYVIAISRGILDEIRSVYNIPEEKTALIYPPLQTKFFNYPLQKNKTDKIIFIGRLTEGKGVFKALEILLNLKNDKATLEFVGHGELEIPLKNKVREFGLEGRVSFAGRQDDILPYLQNADILILPSDYENFATILAESIAYGTPVVAFNCQSGPSEIIKNGVNGYLIPAGDISLFTAKLDDALSRNWDSKLISETAYKFHPDDIIKRYLQIIRQIFL